MIDFLGSLRVEGGAKRKLFFFYKNEEEQFYLNLVAGLVDLQLVRPGRSLHEHPNKYWVNIDRRK